MTIFYELNKDNLTATFWAENDTKNKVSVKGKWQTYSGERASKNNTRIIFSNLPAFCSPQVTLTLSPDKPSGQFVPKLNTRANSGTKVASIELLQVSKFVEYLDNENDKKTFEKLLDKAKQVFAKKQAEAHKLGVQNHIQGLEKLGLTKEALIELLQEQLKTANEKPGKNKAPGASKKTASKKPQARKSKK